MSDGISNTSATIDYWSLKAVHLKIKMSDGTACFGSGFFWKGSKSVSHPTFWLITSWHCLSGINRFTGKYLSGSPNVAPVELQVNYRTDEHMKLGVFSVRKLELFSSVSPKWFEHADPSLNLDIAAIPMTFPDSDRVFVANVSHESDKSLRDDMELSPGMDLFILGFPFSVSEYQLPIWKRASIASEPALGYVTKNRTFFVDSASRRGMSGSLVVNRAFGGYLGSQGDFNMRSESNGIVGIYCGRYRDFEEQEEDLQLGRVHPIRFVEELVENPRPGGNPHFGC